MRRILSCLVMTPFVLRMSAAAPINIDVTLALGPVWKRHVIDNTSRGADGVKLGDIDGDGLPDIVTGWEEGGEVRAYIGILVRKKPETSGCV